MKPARVEREQVRLLTDLPNVGPAMKRDLEFIGVRTPTQLTGRDPLELYRSLCAKSSTRQDPCVLDVFISITRFMDGEEPKPWWAFTGERKRKYGTL